MKGNASYLQFWWWKFSKWREACTNAKYSKLVFFAHVSGQCHKQPKEEIQQNQVVLRRLYFFLSFNKNYNQIHPRIKSFNWRIDLSAWSLMTKNQYFQAQQLKFCPKSFNVIFRIYVTPTLIFFTTMDARQNTWNCIYTAVLYMYATQWFFEVRFCVLHWVIK